MTKGLSKRILVVISSAALVAVFAIVAAVELGAVTSRERPNNQDSAHKTDESSSVWDGQYTEEQSKRGQVVYKETCASCHADALTGDKEKESPALLGEQFMNNWDGLTAGDLFERIRISMPQDDPGKLSRQQIVDVMAFMFNANKFPAGQKALESNLAALKLIRIEKPKP